MYRGIVREVMSETVKEVVNKTGKKKEIELFDNFIDTFIIGRKSLLDNSENPNQFTAEDLEECIEVLKDVKTMNPPKGKEGKEDQSLKTALDKASEKDQSNGEKIKVLLWHCYYIMYLMGQTAKNFFGLNIPKEKDSLFIEKGKEAASTNQVYSGNPIRPFRDLLEIFKEIWGDIKDGSISKKEIKQKIVEILIKEQ